MGYLTVITDGRPKVSYFVEGFNYLTQKPVKTMEKKWRVNETSVLGS